MASIWLFVAGRWKAFRYVFRGMWMMFREPSFMVQSGLTVLTGISGYFMHFSAVDWALFALAWGLILTTETLNTSIERLADRVESGYDEAIRDVKDLAAGGVGWAATTGLVLYIILIIKHI